MASHGQSQKPLLPLCAIEHNISIFSSFCLNWGGKDLSYHCHRMVILLIICLRTVCRQLAQLSPKKCNKICILGLVPKFLQSTSVWIFLSPLSWINKLAFLPKQTCCGGKYRKQENKWKWWGWKKQFVISCISIIIGKTKIPVHLFQKIILLDEITGGSKCISILFKVDQYCLKGNCSVKCVQVSYRDPIVSDVLRQRFFYILFIYFTTISIYQSKRNPNCLTYISLNKCTCFTLLYCKHRTVFLFPSVNLYFQSQNEICYAFCS